MTPGEQNLVEDAMNQVAGLAATIEQTTTGIPPKPKIEQNDETFSGSDLADQSEPQDS